MKIDLIFKVNFKNLILYLQEKYKFTSTSPNIYICSRIHFF